MRQEIYAWATVSSVRYRTLRGPAQPMEAAGDATSRSTPDHDIPAEIPRTTFAALRQGIKHMMMNVQCSRNAGQIHPLHPRKGCVNVPSPSTLAMGYRRISLRPSEGSTLAVATRNNVQVSGRRDGRAIVFGHGFGCDQNMWRFVAPAFESQFRVVLFDQVGAGRSDLSAYRSDRYSTLHGYARDLIEIATELELSDAIFVGHSVSAMIGALAANATPGLFGSLVMIGPSPRYIDDVDYVGGFSAAQIEELLDSLDDNHLGWSAALAPVIMANPDRPELGEELANSFCRTDPVIAREFARVTFTSDNRSDLARVAVRTLILQCADDVIAPRAVGDFVHAHIAGSEIVYLRATGHCPNLSAPAEVIAAIRDFV